MAASKMVNFRLKESELDQIDHMAKIQGITRSDWIKNAIRTHIGKSAVTKKVVVPVQAVQVACKFSDPKTCPSQVVRLPTGVKQCTTCGMKKA